jgi:two-component system response regulator (stage 0 sporulation protein A)
MVITDPNAINHLTKELYPTVGKCFNSTTFKVEGAMRHAIELVWNQRDKEAQRKIFDSNQTLWQINPPAKSS